MYHKLLDILKEHAEIVAPDLVDTAEKAEQAGKLFKHEDIDMVLIFPLGYTASMQIVPAVHKLDVPILNIGNPNCRVRVQRPIHEFMDVWCQQGPSHHLALGYGDQSDALEIFAEAIKFKIVRV